MKYSFNICYNVRFFKAQLLIICNILDLYQVSISRTLYIMYSNNESTYTCTPDTNYEIKDQYHSCNLSQLHGEYTAHYV